MLKTIQLPRNNYLITYYQTLDEVIWLLRQEKLNKRNVLKNLKIANFIKKFLKFERLNYIKQIHWKLQPCSSFLSDRGKSFLALENGQISEIDKNFRKSWK